MAGTHTEIQSTIIFIIRFLFLSNNFLFTSFFFYVFLFFMQLAC